MKTVRVLSVILFILALTGFIVYEIHYRRTSDFVAPVISADSHEFEAGVNASDAELLAGMTASDNRDGDVTDTLVVASLSKFVKNSTRIVTYAAFDKNNNVGTYTRELTYTDYVAPRFVLNAPLHFHQNDTLDNVTLSSRIHAVDVLDGNISSQIMVTRGDRYTWNEETERQPISIQVSNRAGDTASLELDILFLGYEAFNRQCPNLGDYILYTTVGTQPDYRANILGVRSGTNVISLEDSRFDRFTDFDIDASEADVNTPGVYRVTYWLSDDSSGERQMLGYAEMILIVEEE